MTYTSSVVGSVHYLSPEQVRGEKISTQSDLYSLGILLFEMLTGVLPFTADTPVAVALKHVNEKMPNIRDVNPNVPLILEKIVNKALSKKIRQRIINETLALKEKNITPGPGIRCRLSDRQHFLS